ncbi:MAG: helix-turn-helix transcriptional regulator [Polyangiaceae bacterium]
MAATNLDFQAISGIEVPPRTGVDAFLRDALALAGAGGGQAQAQAQALELSALWQDLINGKWFVRTGFCSETECFLVLEPRASAGSRPPPAHVVTMLEQVLTGESQKALAIDASLSRSTVATRCAGCLRNIGKEHTLSRVPTLLLLAAHAARGMKLGSATVRQIAGVNSERWLVSYERPDGVLRATLSDAEREVTRLLVEGRTHTQMARVRKTSPRTIANQLGASFRKLGVSGRTALVSKLLQLKLSAVSATDAGLVQRLH